MNNCLWLTSWYPNRVDRSDGDFIQRHARAVALFCKVHVICVVKAQDKLSDETESNKNGDLSEQIIYYSSPKTGIKLLDRFLSQRKYKQCYRRAITAYIVAQGKPDLVHVHVAMKAGLAALWIKKKWNIPYIVSEHWTGYYKQASPSVYDYNAIFKRMATTILKEAVLFLPVSKDLGETVKQNFVDISYKVIPNVVDTDLFYFKRAATDKFRFIHVSYLNYQKNPEGILKACSLLRQKEYDFELLMLGNKVGSLESIVQEDPLLINNVFFEDEVPYAEVAKKMQDSSALLLFSRFENLPCVVLEALCCGLPVISSNVGGIPEVINKENGILMESENVTQLAEAMKQLIDNYAGYNREQIAGQAREQFSYETVGAQLLAVYNDVLK